MSGGEIGLLVSAARTAADTTRIRDYRGKFVSVATANIHAICALALAIDKFADAITPKENT